MARAMLNSLYPATRKNSRNHVLYFQGLLGSIFFPRTHRPSSSPVHERYRRPAILGQSHHSRQAARVLGTQLSPYRGAVRFVPQATDKIMPGKSCLS
ncbi:hypothetical protein HBI23_130710 [Parastagonospora nodorum]|nr:hypothetical protein HBI47_030220 [Parastagonospora nodorum]KAH5660115.1 hypothetical protein HBI23_130710 [Parastagonospora nodorum]